MSIKMLPPFPCGEREGVEGFITILLSPQPILLSFQEYSVTFSSYFNVLWQEPRLHINYNFFNVSLSRYLNFLRLLKRVGSE